MQIVLIIKNSSYVRPFSINRGSSVACIFSDGLENHPLLPKDPPLKRRNKRQLIIPK
jgi:hypothetical protein